jgi:hypothetical protein
VSHPAHPTSRAFQAGRRWDHLAPPCPPRRDQAAAAGRSRCALDDLSGQALRFARWQAARDAKHAREKEQRAAQGRLKRAAQNGKRRRGPYDRTGPLKPGHPPGWRRKSTHEVHEVLKDLQYFAVHALEKPDTS